MSWPAWLCLGVGWRARFVTTLRPFFFAPSASVSLPKRVPLGVQGAMTRFVPGVYSNPL